MRVAVVGAGIAGLAAAWELRQEAEVVVHDAARPGGKLRTEDFGGRPVDTGPDAFIARVPEAVDLCAELGLTGELVAPAAGSTLVWGNGALLPLPPGLVLGVPKRVGALRGSGIGPVGLARAALDRVLPRRAANGDVSVHELVASRLGRAVADTTVAPLVGAIHAGRIDRLSARATVPQLVAAAGRHRSLMRGLTDVAATGDAGPVFLTPRGGTGVLAARLTERLAGAGVTFSSVDVSGVRVVPGGVEVDGVLYDAAVLAVAATSAARLLGPAAPVGLGAVRTTSVALTTLSYAAADLRVPEGVNGILVPQDEGRLMTACSFASSKWPHWAPPDRVVLRVSAGRDGDQRSGELDDEALCGRLVDEIGHALGGRAVPVEWRVTRWPDSFPQYDVGHLDRMAAVEGELSRTAPGVALAGSSYRGAGIPACIASGRRAARRVFASLHRT